VRKAIQILLAGLLAGCGGDPCEAESLDLWGEVSPPYEGFVCLGEPAEWTELLRGNQIAPDEAEPWTGPGLYFIEPRREDP
jgi:hypothetical protein